MILCAVAVIIFVSAKYKNGFIKNIANQLPCSTAFTVVAGLLIASKIPNGLYVLIERIINCFIMYGYEQKRN